MACSVYGNVNNAFCDISSEDVAESEPPRLAVILIHRGRGDTWDRSVEERRPLGQIVEKPRSGGISVEWHTETFRDQLHVGTLVDPGMVWENQGESRERPTGQLTVQGSSKTCHGRGIDTATERDDVVSRQTSPNGLLEEFSKSLLYLRGSNPGSLQKSLGTPVRAKSTLAL
jgi:hypothetical protein